MGGSFDNDELGIQKINGYLIDMGEKKACSWFTSTSRYMDWPNWNWRLSTRGIVYYPDKEKGIEYYADADFAGGWDQADANNA